MAYIPKNTFQFKKYGQTFETKESKNWLKDKSHVTIYHTTRWRKLRELVLMTSPVCQVENCNKPAYFVDHIVPISDGGEIYEESNLQTLCKSCNGRKTVLQKVKNKTKF